MIVGSVKAFQSHASHFGIPLPSGFSHDQRISVMAPGGTVQLTKDSPYWISYYTGTNTTVNLPPAATLEEGYFFNIGNPGAGNPSLQITVQSSDGVALTTPYLGAGEAACFYFTKKLSSVPPDESSYWTITLDIFSNVPPTTT